MNKVVDLFKQFDLYRKIEDEDLKRVQTTGGAFISIICVVACFFLFLCELFLFLKVDIKNDLSVDHSLGTKMDISFDIVIPRMQCRYLSVAILDKSGVQQFNVQKNIHKHDVDKNGTILTQESVDERMKDHISDAKNEEVLRRRGDGGECLSCGVAGDPDECCNTCDDVLGAYYRKGMSEAAALQTEQCKKEIAAGFSAKNLTQVSQERGGCNMHGVLNVNKVEGCLQISPSTYFSLPGDNEGDVMTFLRKNFNISHQFRRFCYGSENPYVAHNPLNNETKTQNEVGQFNYFTKVVPTTYITMNGSRTDTYQYSVNEYFKPFVYGVTRQPAISIYYDLSPIRVTLTEQKYSTSFLHFLTSLSAIVGGVFTVAMLLDSCLFRICPRKRRSH